MAYLWAAGLLVPAVLICIYRQNCCRQSKAKKGWETLLLACVFFAGVLRACLACRPDTLTRLVGASPDKEIEEAVCEGTVSWIEERENTYLVYLRPSVITRNQNQYRGQGIVWRVSKEEPVFGGRLEETIYPGDRLRLSGRISGFSEPSNPGVFDSVSYYRAKGYLWQISDAGQEQIRPAADGPLQLLWRFRLWMKSRIASAARPEDAGIFAAVFLGESGLADREQKELFRSQGISHLLSVSGLHISFVGEAARSLVFRLTGSLWGSAAAGGLFGIFYSFLTGGTVSAKRALIMFLLRLYASARGRVYDTWSAIGAAALLIAVQNPLCVTQASFQLSFLAVLGLGTAADLWSCFLLQPDRRGLIPILSLQQAMLPAILAVSYCVPLYAPILNLFVIPPGAALLAAAGASACLPGFLGQVGAWAGHLILQYYRVLCRITEMLPGSVQIRGRPPAWKLAIVCAAFLFLAWSAVQYDCWRKQKYSAETVDPHSRKRSFFVHGACIGFLLLEFLLLHADPVRQLTITMMDVGQGDGCLIEVPGGSRILSDCGSTGSGSESLAEYVLEPVLLSKGIGMLDAVILSHSDEDHINGVRQLLERNTVSVRMLFLPAGQETADGFSELLQLAAEQGCKVGLLSAGNSLDVGAGTEIAVLHPEAQTGYASVNDTSIVFRLTCGSFSMLFTGDISSSQEEADPKPVSVLKVPHHGSKYSSSSAWLSKLHPQAAVISCGRKNRYGHPHAETLSRLEAVGTDCFLTPECGAVIIETDGTRFTIRGYRDSE